MGLDASVYCDCIEKGLAKTPHPFPERLFIGADGIPDMTDTEPLEEWLLHDEWVNHHACEHEGCVLLGHWIGNIAIVGFLRSIMAKLFAAPEEECPVIRNKVIYSGTHCGDSIPVELLLPLKEEVSAIQTRDFSVLTSQEIEYVSHFLMQMNELIEAALRVNKPIVF
jgi:hypothetical protein